MDPFTCSLDLLSNNRERMGLLTGEKMNYDPVNYSEKNFWGVSRESRGRTEGVWITEGSSWKHIPRHCVRRDTYDVVNVIWTEKYRRLSPFFLLTCVKNFRQHLRSKKLVSYRSITFCVDYNLFNSYILVVILMSL